MGALSSNGCGLGLGVAGALLLTFLSRPVRCEEAHPATEKNAEERKLEGVRKEIDRLQATLDDTRREARTLLGELQQLDVGLAIHRRQILLVEVSLDRCRKEIAEDAVRVAGLQGALESGRSELAARLRALYISGPPVFERLVLTARHPVEVVEAYRYASLLAHSDEVKVLTYRSDLSKLREVLARLEGQRHQLTALKTQALVRRRELEGVRSERSRLLAGVQREAEEEQRGLREMTETEEALQRLVEALSSGGAVPPEWRVGFEKFRGLLPWPILGKVLVPFGALKNSRFDTLVPHPGVDLAVVVGQPIRAVFDGAVVFSDWFKGYGNLVVLEHGGGFLTLYAHASERLVAPGDRVVTGQTIARAGDTGSLEGPRLYFEIWRNGKPEDPMGWLTRRRGEGER